jgi:ribonuclease D
MAQKRDVPRSRIIKDDGILEIASYPPNALADFSRYRQVYGLNEKEKSEIIELIQNAAKMPADQWPQVDQPKPLTQSQSALLELLKVLLRIKSDQNGVAAKIIATSDDLELFARGHDDQCSVLRGWRRKIYGEDALALRDGKLALGLDKKGLKLVDVKTGG